MKAQQQPKTTKSNDSFDNQNARHPSDLAASSPDSIQQFSSGAGLSLTPGNIMQLQRSIGNRQVAQLLKSNQARMHSPSSVIQRKINVYNDVEQIKPYLPEHIVFLPAQIFPAGAQGDLMSPVQLLNDASNWSGAQWISNDVSVPFPLLGRAGPSPGNLVSFHLTMTVRNLTINDSTMEAKLYIENLHSTIRKQADQETILATMKKLSTGEYGGATRGELEEAQSTAIKNSMHKGENSKQWNSGNKDNNAAVASHMAIPDIRNIAIDVNFVELKKILAFKLKKKLKAAGMETIKIFIDGKEL